MNFEELGSETVAVLTTYGIRVVGALAALFLGWVVASWIRRTMMRGFERASFDSTLSRFFSNMARYAVLTFTLLGVLGVFGIQTSSFAAVIAAAGLAVGLAFQGTLSNFSSGVMLLVFRPFKVGDVIEAAGVVGAVQEIDLFTTELSTPDKRRFILPNSAIAGGNIENKTHYSERRVDVNVGVSYDADIDETRKVLESVIPKLENTLEEPPSVVYLLDLGDSSVNWVVRVWAKTEDFWSVRQEMVRAIKYALDEAGIGIPYPQMDVHLDGSVGLGKDGDPGKV